MGGRISNNGYPTADMIIMIKSAGFVSLSFKELDIGTYLGKNLIHQGSQASQVFIIPGTEITYALTNEHAHLFEAMLSDLETNVDNVKFQNYGLMATTLEDVFMS